MLRLRLKWLVILIGVGAASSLLVPTQAQALGLFRPCGGGLFRGGCGLWCGRDVWGGSCGWYGDYGWHGHCGWRGGCGWGLGGACGPRFGHRLRCRPRRRWMACGQTAYVGVGDYGPTGSVSGSIYSTPEYSPSPDSVWTHTPSTIPTPTPTPSPTLLPAPAPGDTYLEIPPAPEAPEAPEPAPIPESGARSPGLLQRGLALMSNRDRQRPTSGIVVYVPSEAQVFVNNHPMKTKGTERKFAAQRLEDGKTYNYEVRAVMVRNGAKLERVQKVGLRSGQLEEIAFDFTDTVAPIQQVNGLYPETTLTVLVPEDASVLLDGEDSISVGKVRKFVTTELADGESWKNLEIEVEVERNGRKMTQKKRINVLAGQSTEVEFQFPAARKLAASR